MHTKEDKGRLWFTYIYIYGYCVFDFLSAVGVVGLNTRLGCLNSDLAPDSEAQKMIDAANFSFLAINELEHSFPFWRFMMTPMLRKLFDAQDFFTRSVWCAR